MSNDELERWVTAELHWDPQVVRSAIAVAAHDGDITLRGTVGSYREKRHAQKAVERVSGVMSVTNELQVRVLNSKRRADADLRGAVLQALMLNGVVPSTIDASVDGGWVTLTGTATGQHQRDEAELVAGNVLGVLGIDDRIVLDAAPDAGDVKDSIKRALVRSARIDANQLSVDMQNGTVTVSGVVRSWAEHDAALAAAWAAQGVVAVDDQIVVAY